MIVPAARRHRPTLLIVGCGDVGLRVLRLLRGRLRVLALTSSPARVDALRAAGAVPLVGNLDDAASLGRLAALADWVLHLAPPPARGQGDPRTRALLGALARSSRVRRLVYASTSGVYGDAQGARFDETRPVRPATDRARRRVDAEARVRWHGRAFGVRCSVLRVPGIYALDREGGDPRERVRRGAPLLAAADDVYTNHIHADDLARACVAALFRAAPQRVIHASDDSELKMGEHFDAVADAFGLPRAPRLTREALRAAVSEMQWSFMAESRRLDNGRLHRELRLQLRYPTPAHAWPMHPAAGRVRSSRDEMVERHPSLPDEAALATVLRRVALHDETALAALYDALGARVYALALRHCGAAAQAERVTEAAFWELWRQAPRFDASLHRPLHWVAGLVAACAARAVAPDAREAAA
jgi:nucleoside-diphosphate-sugar epimerase